MSKSVLAFSKVHIVGTSSLVLGSNSVVSHEWPKWNAGSWKKWFVCVNESLRKNLELQVVTYIRIRFGHSQVKYPYEKVFFPFGICHVAFPYMDPVSFLSKSVQKVVLSCFSEWSVRKTTQQSHGCCNGTCPSQLLQKSFKKGRFISANTYDKHIVTKKQGFVRQDDKVCFLPICRYHIKLMGDLKKLVPWMDCVSITNTWNVCIHFSSTNSVGKLLSRVYNSSIRRRRQFISTPKLEECIEFSLWRKSDSWGKSTKNTCWGPSKTLNRRGLVGQSLETELNKLKRLILIWGWQKK